MLYQPRPLWFSNQTSWPSSTWSSNRPDRLSQLLNGAGIPLDTPLAAKARGVNSIHHRRCPARNHDRQHSERGFDWTTARLRSRQLLLDQSQCAIHRRHAEQYPTQRRSRHFSRCGRSVDGLGHGIGYARRQCASGLRRAPALQRDCIGLALCLWRSNRRSRSRSTVDGLLDIGGGQFHPDAAIAVSNRTLTVVPEPNSAIAMMTGLCGLVWRRKRPS